MGFFVLLLWFYSIPFLLRTLPRADMESAPTVCQSRNILPAANFGGGAPRPTSYRKGERRAASPLAAVPASGHSKPSVQSPTLTPRRKASLVKGRCRACEAEGFLPVCGCDSVQGIARRNPSGRLRRPPPFDRGGFSAPTLNFTSNFTLAKFGKVCYNLIAYRFSGKYSRNPNQKKESSAPCPNACGESLWIPLVKYCCPA